MTSAWRAAVAVTRAWTRLYTAGVQSHLAKERRQEIDSDLWEMQNDPDSRLGLGDALLVLRRLGAGITDDLTWRVEQGTLQEQLLTRRVVATLAATTLVVTLWLLPWLFIDGRRNVTACADGAPTPQTTLDYRLEVLRCAGAFFAPPDQGPGDRR